jgi:tRNA pseudouridine55 synthase
MNAWLNLYKPKGISSAKAVALVKKVFPSDKIGHTGTLDLEAEGVLPIAIGQATKLAGILIGATKRYVFTVKFGAKTDTADFAGKVIATTLNIPAKKECLDICSKFIGTISQVPPAYSALKLGGVRAYQLARKNKEVKLAGREINIYKLECLAYDETQGTATYEVECSKGTYVRTLAEDIALSLQSLGFVVELRRTKVGMFKEQDSVNVSSFLEIPLEEAASLLKSKCLKIEDVLDDIPVLEASDDQAKQITFGQKTFFDNDQNYELVWVRHDSRIIAIGTLHHQDFKSSRVFNY